MSTRIEYLDTRLAPEESLRALHELYLTRDAELQPADPPVPFAQRMADWRHLFETVPVPRWALWEGTEVVATSGMYYDLEQNLENAFGWVYVHPRRRGAGYGRAIAVPMFDAAEDNKRTRFAFILKDGRPEEALTRRAGMKPAYREQVSRLLFQEVDWDLMDSWVARAGERASDYELVFFPSPIDDRYLEAFCDLVFVMNTAPSEDFEEEDEVMTPENWRDLETKMGLRGIELLSYVARHQPTGDLAGYTTVGYHRLQPDLVDQLDTGVDPKHRNKGLGRWLKAAMALKLRDEYPQVQRIDTENAGSNQPMLSINIEMGFKPILIQNVWQGDLATLRENLSV
jgi:GNAT superfamily N-acetyltransferase